MKRVKCSCGSDKFYIINLTKEIFKFKMDKRGNRDIDSISNEILPEDEGARCVACGKEIER